ncbi:carbohydrate binding domain-containing protein [Bacillus timonensis]|nr:carbohydrate binding domain-containing protein [Bacillus timonensis]
MERKLFHVFLVLLLIGSSFTPTIASSQANTSSSNNRVLEDSDWKLVWSDEFNGTELDQTKWSYDTGNGFVDPSGNYIPGWGNQELQYYSEDNVKVQDGKLLIEGKKETAFDDRGTYEYTSGKVTTRGKFSKTFGKFEARIKLPQGQGFWPAFWMMPEDDVYGGWAASGEIDIMEAAGGRTNKVGGAIHYGGQWPNNAYTAKDYTFPDGQDITDFHVYSVEWEPGEIRFYVDGNLFQTLNNWNSTGAGNATKYSYPAPFDQEFFLILNLAIGGWYGGNPDATTNFPGTMEVDYVKVYELEGKEYLEPVEPTFEKEELPAGSKAPMNGSYIYDPSYEKGFTSVTKDTDSFDTTNWNFVQLEQFGGKAVATVDTIGDSKFAKIDITNQGKESYALQLIQNVPLGKGRYYKLSFDAKAASNRNMSVKLNGGAERSWSLYSANYDVALTEEVKSYEYTFQMQAESDALARLEFNVGLNSSPVWIGNVRLEEQEAVDPYKELEPKEPLSNGNHVYNGTFDQGRMDRMTYWNLDASAQAATASVDSIARELFVDVLDGGTFDSIKLVQNGMNLQPLEEYQVLFDGRATSDREIKVGLLSKDGQVNYSDLQTISLTSSMESKTFTFTMPNVKDVEGQLVFFLGGSSHDVVLDNVKMLRLTNNGATLTFDDIFPLKNGEFTNGLDKWSNHVQGKYDGPSSASFEATDGMAKVSIGHEGVNPWDVIFMQEGLSLKAGYKYTVSFDAKSTIDRKFELVVDNASYHRYLSETLDLTSEMKSYTFEFEMPQDDTVGLKYLLGKLNGVAEIGQSHDVFFDNVKLEIKGEREKIFPLKNGSFTDGGTNWGQHVQGIYDGNSKAEILFDNGEATVKVDHTGVNPWDVLFFQENLSLISGKTYVVQFNAKSSANRKLEVIVDNGAPSYHRYFEKIVDLTDTNQTFTFEFEMGSDDVTGLKFLLGAVGNTVIDSSHTVVIDNVRLEEKGAREALGSEPGNETPTPPSEPTPTEPEPEKKWKEVGENLLFDGSFDSTTTFGNTENPVAQGWNIHNQGIYEQWAGLADFTVEEGQVKALVSQPGWAWWQIQLYQDNVTVPAGTYKISFDMQSEQDRPVYVELAGSGVPMETFHVNGTLQTYETIIEVTSDGQYKFLFGFGKEAADPELTTPYAMTIDNVKLMKVVEDTEGGEEPNPEQPGTEEPVEEDPTNENPETPSTDDETGEDSEEGEQLPDTATSSYNWLVFGFTLMMSGVILLAIQRRRKMNHM